MFFGEFLVMKKVINEDQLLDALTYQIEHLPSFLRVLREEKIVSTSDLFKMVRIQLETNSDLVGVLRDENKIDEKQLHALFAKQASKRKMLGEVLVELKITDQATVENMLYDFLRNKDNLKAIKTEQQIESVKKVSQEIEMSEAALESLRELGMDIPQVSIPSPAPAATATSPTMSEAALESLRELGMALEDMPKASTPSSAPVESNVFVEEFLNIFNVKMKNKLNKILEILKASEHDDSDISNYFNSLYRDLHVLKGAAQVGDLSQTENFISEWENVVEKILSKNIPEMRSWCSVGLPALESALSYLWKMRETINKDKTDVNIKPMPELINTLKNL